MTARLSAIAALLIAAFPTILLGQTSEEYVAMGHKLWDAFVCGAFAEYADSAHPAIGHATAAPPSVAMSSRRPMWIAM